MLDQIHVLIFAYISFRLRCYYWTRIFAQIMQQSGQITIVFFSLPISNELVISIQPIYYYGQIIRTSMWTVEAHVTLIHIKSEKSPDDTTDEKSTSRCPFTSKYTKLYSLWVMLRTLFSTPSLTLTFLLDEINACPTTLSGVHFQSV